MYTVNDRHGRKRTGEHCLFSILDANRSKNNSRMAPQYWSCTSRSLLQNLIQVKSSHVRALQGQKRASNFRVVQGEEASIILAENNQPQEKGGKKSIYFPLLLGMVTPKESYDA